MDCFLHYDFCLNSILLFIDLVKVSLLPKPFQPAHTHTIFIPSAIVSYYGAALDEKTPLLRVNAAVNKQGVQLLKHLGLDLFGEWGKGIRSNIGLEQEIFLIPREAYYKRPDLQMTGRTVIGKDAPRGQEMCDHYMAPLSSATPALACMQEIQDEAWKMGIPLKTRHCEVAPNQFEFAPIYGYNTTQIDQNLMVMQIIEEVAPRHGLTSLLQEKPSNDVNGSGKHNNWSLATADGVQLLDPKDEYAFPVIMAAVVAAVDEHGDLMRMAIPSPGNDFRLGACEAPPAIVSTYLGDDMTFYLEHFKDGKGKGEYVPGVKTLDLGTREVNPLQVPAEDRNRTSPFPYGGSRFEFRAVRSAQKVSMVNTCLNTMVAEKFKEFADRIDAGENAVDIAREALNKHWRVIYNGDNYCEEAQEELTNRGIWRIDSGVEAIHTLTSEKNVKLFEKMGDLTKEESEAREAVLHDHYTGTVEMEALPLVDMINQHIIPSCKKSGVGNVSDLESTVKTVKDGVTVTLLLLLGPSQRPRLAAAFAPAPDFSSPLPCSPSLLIASLKREPCPFPPPLTQRWRSSSCAPPPKRSMKTAVANFERGRSFQKFV